MKFDEMQFKPTITIAEKARLVTSVVESLFDGEEYLPEILEEEFWIHVVSAYLTEGSVAPEFKADDFMDTLYNQGLMECIKSAVNADQLESVRVAILKRIDMRLSKKPVDEFFEKASALLSKIESAVEGVDLKGAFENFDQLDISAELAKALAKNRATGEGK